MHDSDPASALYFPETHSEHVPPSGPEEPALQVQAVAMRLPTGELESDGHVSHVAAPGRVLKVPALQDVHVPPSGPEEPALQVQVVAAPLEKRALVEENDSSHSKLILRYLTSPLNFSLFLGHVDPNITKLCALIGNHVIASVFFSFPVFSLNK